MKRFSLGLAVFFALTLPASGQQNEVGFFLSMGQFDSTTIPTDPDVPSEVTLDFNGRPGYGVSYNRYWTDALSTEFAVQQINADSEITATSNGSEITIDFGSIELAAFTAVVQWHFTPPESTFGPYIGAGMAYTTGQAEFPGFEDPDEELTADFESETSFVLNAGIDLRFGRGFAIGVDAKYIPYQALEEGVPEEEAVDLNPLVLAAGIKLRF